jgi:hypothetical protein
MLSLLVYGGPYVIFAAFAWYVLSARMKFKRVSRMAAGALPVENLVPLAEYDTDATGYWRRSRWVSGLGFGLGVATLPLISTDTFRFSPPVVAALTFALGGPAFGILFPAGMRGRVRRFTAALYAGERWIIDPPPAKLMVSYQVPCTWLSGKASAGGVLYLGRAGLLFMPHKRSRKPWHPTEMGPIAGMKAGLLVPPHRNAMQRLLVPRPLRPIEITWSSGTARFLMPRPADTVVKIGHCLEALQHAAE